MSLAIKLDLEHDFVSISRYIIYFDFKKKISFFMDNKLNWVYFFSKLKAVRKFLFFLLLKSGIF